MFLGNYTIAELIDLISAKTDEFRAIDTSLSNIGNDWTASDPTGYTAFVADYTALRGRWLSALGTANTAITESKMSPLPASAINADAEYHGILSAIQPGGSGTVTPGDLVDITRRLQAAGGKAATRVTQPSASDADLGVFKASDTATKNMPDFVKTGVATFAPGLVPKNADAANYKPVSATTKYMIIGGAVLALVAIVRR